MTDACVKLTLKVTSTPVQTIPHRYAQSLLSWWLLIVSTLCQLATPQITLFSQPLLVLTDSWQYHYEKYIRFSFKSPHIYLFNTVQKCKCRVSSENSKVGATIQSKASYRLLPLRENVIDIHEFLVKNSIFYISKYHPNNTYTYRFLCFFRNTCWRCW